MKYAVVVERSDRNYAAWVPDLPVAWPRDGLATPSSGAFAAPFAFTSRGFAPPGCRSRIRPIHLPWPTLRRRT